MPILSSELRAIHEQHSWLPFTQMKYAPEPSVVTGGDGVYLTLEDGRRVIDGIGSWWVNTYGHSNVVLAEVLAKQANELEHVIFANFVHEPALRLAQKLSEKTNHQLPRVYFSDNGSTAVEIGIKMAYQYFKNRGEDRGRIACLANGYHGDTFGAMSAGARSIFHKPFEPLLFDVDHLLSPACSQQGLDDEAVGRQEIDLAIRSLESHFEQYGDRTCCLLMEPLIQGSEGMFMYSAAYLRRARQLCDEFGVILIADEVFTGAGRTGPYFAFERAGIWPDIIASAKGLSGGFLPFAVTLASNKIYNGFLSDDRSHALYHGHSMTGSVLGCSVSLAAIDLYEKLNVAERLRVVEQRHKRGLSELQNSNVGEWVSRPRALGSVMAFDLAADIDYGALTSKLISEEAMKHGLFLRPLGGTMYLCPAFTITDDELDEAYHAISLTLKALPQILRKST